MQRPLLNRFHTYDEIQSYLFAARDAYPALMQLAELARTEEGRVIWGVTLSRGHADDHPAFYVQGGVHAEEGMGVTGALNFLHTVLENPGLLDQVTVYILPCVNPDGSDACVCSGLGLRSKIEPRTGIPNALVPRDLNGDGKILSMRWRDPLGARKTPPRGDMLVPRVPGDTNGPFYSMCTEGMLENYDGGAVAPGTRGLDFNRQYANSWRDAENGGDYPGRHAEPRTVMEFLTTHPNIFAAIDLHCGTRALIYGTPANTADAALLRRIALLCRDVAGIEPIPDGDYGRPDGSAPTVLPGHFETYCYESLGILAATVELGNGYNSLGMTAHDIFNADLYGEALIARLTAMHAARGRAIAEPWAPYRHPQLGDVEIGGRVYGNAYFMDPDDMIDLLPKVADYLLRLAAMAPALTLGNVACDALGGRVVRVRAEAMNTGVLGTTVMQGSSGYHAHRDAVRFTLSGAKEILSRPATPAVAALRSMERTGAEWFIRADPGDTLTVTVSHPKAGYASVSVLVPAL